MNTPDQTFKAYADLIEARLNALIPDKREEESPLFEAARYSLLSGGKRIRPILTLATAELFGVKRKDALPPACAIEMIHAYSLIHDDLPCMDDDDFRRGKPSLHKQYGEAIAVLAGNYLQALAFETVAAAESLSAEIRLALVDAIAKASGGDGMIGGQAMDIISEGLAMDRQMLQQLHKKKTGALIACSIKCGCLVAQAPLEQKRELENFAEAIGLAFQVVDDLLDLTAGDRKRGPQKPSDLTNNKCTYATLLGIDQAREEVERLFQSALASLKKLPMDTTLMEELTSFMIKRSF